jgi:hypothetical protein
VRSTAEAMLDTCFIFLVSDYIIADGSLSSVLDRVQGGASGVQAGNFQIVAEDAIPLLRERVDSASPALALSARELMGWSLEHLHPATTANIVNFQLTHNVHTNRLFWRVDESTLIGRFYLMHMIGVRPEVNDFVTGASCDYSFIPEMCPSNNVTVLTDSDDYFVVEMQPRDHEAKHLQWGAHDPRKLADSLSEWTTARHRENVHSTLIYHRADIPDAVAETKKQADEFLEIVNRNLSSTPKPFRHHPYWIGSIASHRSATRQAMSSEDWTIVLGESPPSGGMAGYLRNLRLRLFGNPPEVSALHPRWPDYRLILEQLQKRMTDNARILVVADRPLAYAHWIAKLNENIYSLETTRLLEMPAQEYMVLVDSFDLCILFLNESELKWTDSVLQRAGPILNKSGQIILTVMNGRTQDVRGFSPSFAYHAGRLHSFNFALDEVLYVHSTWLRSSMQAAIARLAETVQNRSAAHLPIVAAKAGLYSLATLVGNLRARQARTEPPSHGYCSSVLVCMHPSLPPEKRPLPQFQRDPRRSQWDKEFLRMQSNATNYPLNRSLVLRDQIGLEQLGLRTNQVWHDDPQGLASVLARYHFIGKMLTGRQNVAEVGCSDGFGARIVLQETGRVTVYDSDPVAIEDIRRRHRTDWPVETDVHDILESRLPRDHDAIYSLDAIQFVPPEREYAFVDHIHGSLGGDHDLVIVGTSTPEGRSNVAVPSSVNVVSPARALASGGDGGKSTLAPVAIDPLPIGTNAPKIYTRTGASLKKLMEQRFHSVFLFSMIDETVLAGSLATANYVLALCCGRKD